MVSGFFVCRYVVVILIYIRYFLWWRMLEFIQCRVGSESRIGNDQVPAQVFGKWTDTDVERNVMQ